MFTKLCRFLLIVAAGASIHHASACCALSPWSYDTLRCTVGDRPAIIVTAGTGDGIRRDTSIIDTLYFSEFLARLTTAYFASDLVFIAKVTSAVSFMPAIDALGQEVFQSESVTVTLETQLKGNPLPNAWNFISRDETISQRWILDSLTGEITVGMMQMSLNETHYASVLGDRYLFFMNENNFSGGENGTFEQMLPEPCDQYSYAYKIDKNHLIYFDGFEFDTLRNSIPNIPEINCKLNDFAKEVLTPFSIGTKPVLLRNEVLSAQMTIYDLLGKRLSRPGRQELHHTTPGLYIRAASGQNEKIRQGFMQTTVR